jgi:hypothetical protein
MYRVEYKIKAGGSWVVDGSYDTERQALEVADKRSKLSLMVRVVDKDGAVCGPIPADVLASLSAQLMAQSDKDDTPR